jgi:transcriptional antiterminator RfaH
MQAMSDAQLSTRDVASRLGISTSDLAELRLKTGELPIEQDGLKLFYSAETVQAFERSEALKVMERVLASQSPLATLTRMAQVSGLTRLYIAGQLVASAIENQPKSSTLDLPAALKRKQTESPEGLLTDDRRKGQGLPTLAHAPSWYLVHTKSRQEQTAIENLERQGYSCFMPTLMVQKIQRSQMRLTSEPMFPRYVFVAGDAFFETKGSSPIRSTMGVHELVHFGMRPAVIQLELLQAIFERQKAHHKAPSSAFKSGDKVALINGPLAGLESIYQAQSGEERSMILLNLLSRPTKVQVATNLLTKIA